MVAFMNFALIHDDKVKNIVVGEYYDCDQAAKATYGEQAYAIDVTQIPVRIGDGYNGRFYRMEDGERVYIDPLPTDSEQIASLVEQNAALNEALENIELALVELYEGGL